MFSSVADRIEHRMPRPVRCDACGSPRVHLQSRKLLGLRTSGKWHLIWHCLDCLALVGCHEGTDIPLGLMADVATRDARFRAHNALDPLWRGRSRRMTRDEAYRWMANVLDIDYDRAHISMLTEAQCEIVIAEVKREQRIPTKRHWTQNKRKRRNK